MYLVNLPGSYYHTTTTATTTTTTTATTTTATTTTTTTTATTATYHVCRTVNILGLSPDLTLKHLEFTAGIAA